MGLTRLGTEPNQGLPGSQLRPTQADSRQLQCVRHLISGPLLDPR